MRERECAIGSGPFELTPILSVERRHEVGTLLRHPERHLLRVVVTAIALAGNTPHISPPFTLECAGSQGRDWSQKKHLARSRRNGERTYATWNRGGDRIDDRSGEAGCGGTSEVNLQVDAWSFRNRRLTFQDCASVCALALS